MVIAGSLTPCPPSLTPYMEAMGQVVFPYYQRAGIAGARGKRLTDLIPRMAPSALRVPHPVHAQIPLVFLSNRPQVFVHEGARQALARRLENAFPGPVSLEINDNVRSVVTIRRRNGQLRAGIHHMFLDAPPAVQEALVRYVVENDRGASALVSRFINENHHRIRASRPPLNPLRTRGQTHDLMVIFQRVNQRYFGNTHDALVTWGKSAGTSRKAKGMPSRRSIKLGSYSAVERLIRVHPVLDRKWVPRYFVEYILYHEMLHHVIPSSRDGGRAMLHPKEFREREREFHGYERAIAWERAHLGRLLRA